MALAGDSSSAENVGGPRIGGASRGNRSLRRFLPPPVSERHGVSVLVLGFAMEGATELYQFAERGNLGQGPLEYYLTLATTIFGFYLMFLGLREWIAFPPRQHGGPAIVPSPRRRRFGLGLWIGGTAAAAVLSTALGGAGAGASPVWIAWPVAGLVVLAFGDFFFGLRSHARRLRSPIGNAAGWTAFAWSLGVATVAGLVVGDRVILLLTEFVTNWIALIASFAPIVIAMSPLFVSYALMIGAFWPGLRRSRTEATGHPPVPSPGTAEVQVEASRFL
jgi:hypothetical protein